MQKHQGHASMISMTGSADAAIRRLMEDATRRNHRFQKGIPSCRGRPTDIFAARRAESVIVGQML